GPTGPGPFTLAGAGWPRLPDWLVRRCGDQSARLPSAGPPTPPGASPPSRDESPSPFSTDAPPSSPSLGAPPSPDASAPVGVPPGGPVVGQAPLPGVAWSGTVAELLGLHPAFLTPGQARELALAPGTTMHRILVDPADGRCIERTIASYRP